MNVFITGSEGLIGTFLRKRLEARGDRIVGMLDKRSGIDICDIEKIEVKEKIDMMIHLAAHCKINQSIQNPESVFKPNVEGVYRTLEFCRRNKIPKIVFTSSSRVLSREKNPYTASKVYGEEMVKAYSQCYGVEYVIIRPSTVYGPFNDLTKRLIDIFILAALQGKELQIFGDEKKTLDCTYIDDFIDGFLLAMGQKNKAFDISAGKGINVSYLADFVINLAGKGTKRFYPPELAQPQEVELDISPIKAIGYSPKVSIEEGVKRTFEFYRNNLNEILMSRNVLPILEKH